MNAVNPSQDTRPPLRRFRWLCIAYAFPPINRSGTHRTLGFVQHLDRLGADATVLTVEPGQEPTDHVLLGKVPASTQVIRTQWANLHAQVKTIVDGRGSVDVCGRQTPRRSIDRQKLNSDNHSRNHHPRSLREWVSHALLTPDSRIGWIPPAVRAGLRAVRRHRPDVIYSTSPYMSAHLIGLILARWTHKPWVADFRDPWSGNPFRDLGFETLKRWDAWLESLVLREASQVVCTTPTLMNDLCRRHPGIADKCVTILNGFDRECFKDIQPNRSAGADEFVLIHCGQFYGPRSPKVWFEALKRARVRSPRAADRIRIVLVGPDRYDGTPLTQIASDIGVADRVDVLGNKGHAESLSLLAGGDALMLAGSDGPRNDLQVPNKLYEYLAIRKPILAAVAQDNPTVGILQEARAEAIICPPGDVEALAQAMIRLASRRNPVIDNAWSGVDRFDRARCAEQLLDIFQRVTHCRAPRRSNGSRRLKPSAREMPNRVTAFGGVWSTTGLRTSE